MSLVSKNLPWFIVLWRWRKFSRRKRSSVMISFNLCCTVVLSSLAFLVTLSEVSWLLRSHVEGIVKWTILYCCMKPVPCGPIWNAKRLGFDFCGNPRMWVRLVFHVHGGYCLFKSTLTRNREILYRESWFRFLWNCFMVMCTSQDFRGKVHRL